MAFLDNVFKKEESVDIEDFLNNMDMDDQTLYEDADAYVKPLSLNSDDDVNVVLNEAKAGNIVLLNIEPLAKRNALKLKNLVESIKEGVATIDGDIARISQDRVLITPSKVKIMKNRK